jgi:glyoxylase-like metal-dependent hydrolase (beta-lactamase superfamily II)
VKPPVLHLVGALPAQWRGPGGARGEALGFADQEVLDVPGRPRVIHVPGHTAGNTALSLDDREVLIVGDTLSTLSLSRGEESEPQLLPPCMNEDHDRALASLEKIELINASWSCPLTVFRGREVRSRPSSWPGRSRPGQGERPVLRLPTRMCLPPPLRPSG